MSFNFSFIACVQDQVFKIYSYINTLKNVRNYILILELI
jgi:hypothetical protein